MHLASKICESIAGVDDNTLITALLQDISAFLVRPAEDAGSKRRAAGDHGNPGAADDLDVRNNEDYLGRVGFTMVRQEMADVFLFPVHGKRRRVFCVVVARPYDMDDLVAKVTRFLSRLSEKIKALGFL